MTKYDAMITGIEKAKALGLEKPMDVAVVITVALHRAGYRIVSTPRKEVK